MIEDCYLYTHCPWCGEEIEQNELFCFDNHCPFCDANLEDEHIHWKDKFSEEADDAFE